jgi:hypothetical protein
MQKNFAVGIAVGLGIFGATACKKKVHEGELQSIVSTDEQFAFGFVGVSDPDAASKRLQLALVECESGAQLKAADWLLRVTNLGVFGETYLTRGGKLQIKSEFGVPHDVPCRQVKDQANRTTSLYDMNSVAAAFRNAANAQDFSGPTAESSYIAAQALFLSMRGPSSLSQGEIVYGDKATGVITFATYHEIARSDGSMTDAQVEALTLSIKARDPVYNPCDSRSPQSLSSSVPLLVSELKQKSYVCHPVGRLHMYRLRGGNYVQTRQSVANAMERAHAAAAGGPRTRLTEGLSLNGTAQGSAPAAGAVSSPAPVMDVFQVAVQEQKVNSGPSVDAFKSETRNPNVDGVVLPKNMEQAVASGDGYLIGTQGDRRSTSSLFQIGNQAVPFSTVGSGGTSGFGTPITTSQSVGTIGDTGRKATTHDALGADGVRHVQTWVPMAAPGLDGFREQLKVPGEVKLNVSRLQGVDGKGTVEKYSWTDPATKKTHYALGVGGIADPQGQPTNLFLPMDETPDGKSLTMSDSARSTAKAYTDSLAGSPAEIRTEAQQVFNSMAQKTVLNSDPTKGAVGMGYFSHLVSGQQALAPTTLTDQQLANLSASKPFSSVGAVNPVKDRDGNPVFSASRTITNPNTERGGGGVEDRFVANFNANVPPQQADQLAREVQERHLALLESQVRIAREQETVNRKLYGRADDAAGSRQLEASRDAVRKAEQELFNYQYRNRPDFLSGKIAQLDQSINAAEDQATRQSLEGLRERYRSALSDASRYRQNPMAVNIQVDEQGRLIDYSMANRAQAIKADNARLAEQYRSELASINRVYSDDLHELNQRRATLVKKYTELGFPVDSMAGQSGPGTQSSPQNPPMQRSGW